MTDEDRAVVAHALAYPFNPPRHAFLFSHGMGVAFGERAATLMAGRTPVLAVGSNGSVQRLREKFGDGVEIPVSCAVVRDHVVCHSAQFSSYGSVPATVHPWAGARSDVLVTWLTDEMLAVMDRTEDLGVAYDRVKIPCDLLAGEGGGDGRDGVAADLKAVDCYVSLAGAMGDAQGPIVTAAARVLGGDGLSCLDQKGAQMLAMRVLAAEGGLEEFVLANVRDGALRTERCVNICAAVGLSFPA